MKFMFLVFYRVLYEHFTMIFRLSWGHIAKVSSSSFPSIPPPLVWNWMFIDFSIAFDEAVDGVLAEVGRRDSSRQENRIAPPEPGSNCLYSSRLQGTLKKHKYCM